MKKTLITGLIIVCSFLFSTVAQAATYHVAQSKFPSWKFSCDVVTKGNKVTAVKKLSIKPFIGSISSPTVKLSGGDAHIRFAKHIKTLAYNQNIKISVSKSKIYVTTN
ncbi:hypothetical protein HC026_07060 [Lactobacillus sp. LC28-10]|uniref:DUF5626 domain-containing protein n=1 Tax=Secundilactobacillus angelensis TaxID=2722706 RepID=A0ABX1L0T8_9LACO|nr:DUF5626 family protein [Secundilactobacillus angelensis]MCH5462958.1 DUF5626 family protein [Secundilactobacillus angelensis]NLR18683.1 hypothetical protein [Secundilactobacillus angelensis]